MDRDQLHQTGIAEELVVIAWMNRENPVATNPKLVHEAEPPSLLARMGKRRHCRQVVENCRVAPHESLQPARRDAQSDSDASKENPLSPNHLTQVCVATRRR